MKAKILPGYAEWYNEDTGGTGFRFLQEGGHVEIIEPDHLNDEPAYYVKGLGKYTAHAVIPVRFLKLIEEN